MTIANDDASVFIKWSFKLIDIARGVIYDRHMFIVQATDEDIFIQYCTSCGQSFIVGNITKSDEKS